MLTRKLTRKITERITRAITSPGVGGVAAWTPAALFESGEQGVWYDPSDFSTMFQDSAGTTPVTAVEQPVGLILDKRLGAARGAEQIIDPEFNDPTKWTEVGTAWSVSGGKATHNGSAADYLYTATEAPTVGEWYEATIVVSAFPAGSALSVYFGQTPSVYTIYAAGTYRIIGRSPGTGLKFSLRASNATGLQTVVESFSVRPLPGNHASQSTTAARPKLRLDGANYYSAFDRVDDHLTVAAGGGGTTGICVCAAIRAGGAGNARTIWSDRGTNTGYRLSINASNQLVLSAGNGSAHTEVVGPTVTAGTDYVVTGWHDGTNLNVQLNAGSATSAAFGTATAGTAGFTIGMDNGAATGYYGDRIYEIVYRKDDTSSAGDRASLITYMAEQAGVAL